IEAAAAAIPPSYVPHIVVLSDGNQTTGDALKAALRAKMPISTVPLKTREEPEVQVSAVNVPAQVRQGEPFNVEIVIDSNHDVKGQAMIELFRGAHKVLSEKHTIKKGENRFIIPQSLTQERLATYTAKIRFDSEGQDTLLDNNTASGL